MINGPLISKLYANDLRGRTIQRIMSEGNFDMNYWSPKHREQDLGVCGTACCIAGNILYAAGEDPSERECNFMFAAKTAWAKEYGEESARKLQFYNAGTNKCVTDVTPEDAIRHLLSV